jgi:hypothetical protein
MDKSYLLLLELQRLCRLIGIHYADDELLDSSTSLLEQALIEADFDVTEALSLLFAGYCGDPTED